MVGKDCALDGKRVGLEKNGEETVGEKKDLVDLSTPLAPAATPPVPPSPPLSDPLKAQTAEQRNSWAAAVTSAVLPVPDAPQIIIPPPAGMPSFSRCRAPC